MDFLNIEINQEKLQEKAKEAAEQAYLSEIEDFYKGYSSPYRKAVREALNKVPLNIHVNLPDIIGKLNESLENTVKSIAENVIAATYMPLFKEGFLVSPDKITWNEFLQEIVKKEDLESDLDLSFEYNIDERFGWLNCYLKVKEKEYQFTLHEKGISEDIDPKKYTLLTQASAKNQNSHSLKRTVAIYKDDKRIDIPEADDILRDETARLLFGLLLSGTTITMDFIEVEDSWFSSDDACQC